MTGGLNFPECALKRYWLLQGPHLGPCLCPQKGSGTQTWQLYPKDCQSIRCPGNSFFQLSLHSWTLSISFLFPFAKLYCRNGCLYLPYDGALIVRNSQQTYCVKTKSIDFQNVLCRRLPMGHGEGEDTEPCTPRQLRVCCLIWFSWQS